ncbi:MAG: DegT/DnrJ/EryC1/StrS family aminotransferase [Candidatus Goldbacteria bacterium]|nr:DegT/DnrJ/EryC1/StrS family aminotransferase [Candidatus Goldiibacteriota bacterium]
MITVGDFKIDKEEKDIINEVLDGGKISEGKYVKKFELEFAKKIGTRYCVALSSGTASLISGLLSLIYSNKIKKGSKVITTPVTYISTINAIVLCGLEPVFVDIAEDNFNITSENIEKLLKNSNPEEYSLILPVHLMGYPCDMIAINKIARKYNLLVFEDTAQAHGTKINGKNTGTFSIIADYSFYIAHNIQVGEMGAIVTDDKTLAGLVKSIKANGRLCDCFECTRDKGICPRQPQDETDNDPRFTHNYIGYNFKTMEFQAALGILQISRMDEIIKKRAENIRKLNLRLKKVSGILKLPVYSPNVSYLAYPLILKDNKKISRLKLRRELENRGIETRPLFGCIPTQQPAYDYLRKQYEGKLPVAEYVGSNGFYIGCHQYITDADIEYIGKNFEEILL